jgi:hypothetical protein
MEIDMRRSVVHIEAHVEVVEKGMFHLMIAGLPRHPLGGVSGFAIG